MSENRPFVIARETICWSSEQYADASSAAVVAVEPANASAKRMRRFAILPARPLQPFSEAAAGPWLRPGVTSIPAAGSSALRARGLVERGAQPLGELHRVVIGPEVHEDQPRLLGRACGCGPPSPRCRSARSALITGLTSSPVSTKSPVMAALPPPVGWKPMAVATPSRAGGRELHSVLGDRIAARHRELVDAAIGLSLDADDLIELGGVEIDRGRRRRLAAGGVERRLALRQRRADARSPASPDRRARRYACRRSPGLPRRR